jgi:hypothetical protein
MTILRLLVPLSFAAMVPALPALADQISVTIPTVSSSVVTDPQGKAQFTGEDLQYITASSEPRLPFQIVRVLLPPSAIPASVSVLLRAQQMQDVAGQWEVEPTPPAATWRDGEPLLVWPPGKRIVNGRDMAIYERNAWFPASPAAKVATGRLRAWQLAEVPIALYQYNPVNKTLRRLNSAELVLAFNVSQSSPAMPTRDTNSFDVTGEEVVQKLVINFDQVASQYRQPAALIRTFQPVYLVLTTNHVRHSSAALSAFVRSKMLRGFRVVVATEEAWGGGGGNAAAENIRGWLQRTYMKIGMLADGKDVPWNDLPKYLLLIGNPHPGTGDVPMKMLYPRQHAGYYREAPSDLYYGDLTGNWDLDGDGNYGEYYGDFGPGGVDRYAEMNVGRIPFYGDFDNLNHILSKATAFERVSAGEASWRAKVLLPMVPSDIWTPGYHLGEQIKDYIVRPKAGWGYHRIYEQDYGLTPAPETVGISEAIVTDIWKSSAFGGVFWWTHGWSQGAVQVMDTTNASALNDQRPSFTFQCSCFNSQPEDLWNLSYALLRNGAVGTVGATRVSWYWVGQTTFAGSDSNSGMTYEYARNMITHELPSGDSLLSLKRILSPSCSEMWMNFTVFNLYGDPSLGLLTHR